jgi:glycosyltransferase involved in cell wall biosynthesis
MKILVLCYEYPPLGGGGGRIAKAVAEALAARGHSVRVQTAALGRRSSRETVGGVDVFRTASGRRRADSCTVAEMALYCATSFLPTLRHIRTWQPDVLHVHFAMPTGLLAWAVHQFTAVPYVLTAHLGDVPGGVPEQTDRLFQMIGPLASRVWSRAAACTAVSSFVQELAESAYGRKVTRILNGIALPPEAAPAPASDPPHLVFLGRFNPQKNAPLLLEALAGVRDLDWRLTMIGDGPDRTLVEQAIDRHRLRERVRLAGWLGHAEVHGILREADLLCIPSRAEGLPVAAIEALAHGLAIAGSDIPGLQDVLADGDNGLTAPVNDSAALTSCLRRLLTQPATLAAMQQASLRRARAFDLAAVAAAYDQVLTGAAGTARTC